MYRFDGIPLLFKIVMNKVIKTAPSLMLKSIRNASLHYPRFEPKFHVIPNEKPHELKFIGFIKNMPHYLNSDQEVYVNHPDEGIMEYVADWWDKKKMLWTENPQNYREFYQSGNHYFYDIDFNDAYKYDPKMKLVVHIGRFDPNMERIVFHNFFN